MAVDPTQINNSISSQLPDNSSGKITPAVLRTALTTGTGLGLLGLTGWIVATFAGLTSPNTFTGAQTFTGPVTVKGAITLPAMSAATNLGRVIFNAADPEYGGVWDGATGHDVGPAINAAFAACGATPGGEVDIPAGHFWHATQILNPYNGCRFHGEGEGWAIYGNAPGSTQAVTTLSWNGAASAYQAIIGPQSNPTNGHEYSGMGVSGIQFDCNHIAAVCLEISSVQASEFSYTTTNAMNAANIIYVAQQSEVAGTQFNHFFHIEWKNDPSSTGKGIVLSSINENAAGNVSLNKFDLIRGYQNDGQVGFECNLADTDIIEMLVVYQTAGRSVQFDGSVNNYGGCHNMQIRLLSGQVGQVIYAQGTNDIAYPSYGNTIEVLDTQNGTPVPTLGAGASLVVQRDTQNQQINTRTSLVQSYLSGPGLIVGSQTIVDQNGNIGAKTNGSLPVSGIGQTISQISSHYVEPVTFTNGSAVISNSGTPASTPPVGDTVSFTTTGSLPTNFNTTTNYYVVSSNATTGAFQVSASYGGSAVVAGSAGSGTQGVQPPILTNGVPIDVVVLSVPPGNWLCFGSVGHWFPGNGNVISITVGGIETASKLANNYLGSPGSITVPENGGYQNGNFSITPFPLSFSTTTPVYWSLSSAYTGANTAYGMGIGYCQRTS
jgi:hypothetical protein